jgi:hypothetical protein
MFTLLFDAARHESYLFCNKRASAFLPDEIGLVLDGNWASDHSSGWDEYLVFKRKGLI